MCGRRYGETPLGSRSKWLNTVSSALSRRTSTITFILQYELLSEIMGNAGAEYTLALGCCPVYSMNEQGSWVYAYAG
jgi:hypothetical protein